MAAVDQIEGEWRAYARAVLEAARSMDRLSVMAAVMEALARITGWPVPSQLRLASPDLVASEQARALAVIDPPAEQADAWLLGRVHEAILGAGERRAAGAHYTPRQIAAGLVAWAADDGSTAAWSARVCDPAVGGGAFLLAAAELLLRRGIDPAAIVGDALWGIDLDPVAVAVADAALSHWAWRAGAREPVNAGDHLVTGDALLLGAAAWSEGGPAPGFDLVVGNPPFQGQLGRATARTPLKAAALRARFGDAVAGYADSAALFLLAGCGLARPGGRVALVQPISVFAARDARQVRSALLANGRLEGVWTADAQVFRANVRVGAVVLEIDDAGAVDDDARRRTPMPVRRATGPEFTPRPELPASRMSLRTAGSWSHLITVDGTPNVDGAHTAGRLGDIASATAGFRDQYYGMIPFVAEAPEAFEIPETIEEAGATDGSEVAGWAARLITSGMIDPASCRWGRAPGRFARRAWLRPVVDVDALRAADPRLGRWLDGVLVPKVLMACQTRVIEAIIDEAGTLIPSVPVIAVCAPVDRLFHVAAALLSPFASAWAIHRVAGAALGADAIKLAAKQVLDLPLPAFADAWSEGASHLRSSVEGVGNPATFAATMNRAYGLEHGHDLTSWWITRLPNRT